MQNWQAIETADPTKYERILVYIPFTLDGAKQWDWAVAEWDGGAGQWTGEWRHIQGIDELSSANPTHWKPLTTPEEEAERLAA